MNKSKVDQNFQDNYEEDKVLTELNALESNFENVNLPFENAVSLSILSQSADFARLGP